MNRYRAVIFDWDGTLVDSLDHIAASLAAAAMDCGMQARSSYELRDIIGLGLDEALDRLWPGITPSQVLQLRQAYAGHFFSAVATPLALYQGVAELLQMLGKAQPALAVATGKSRAGLDRALASTGLGERFRLTRCADETRSKPDPTMLREIIGELGIEPGEALMIGDTVYDLEMASNLGMPSVGVTWGVHEASALAEHRPVRIVDTVDELSRFLADNVRQFDLHTEEVVDE